MYLEAARVLFNPVRALIVGSLLLALTSCSSGNSTGTEGKYEQTWPESYSATACAAWLNRMDPHQRFAAAADMLTGARNKGDGGTGVPDDDLIKAFEKAVDGACAAGSGSLARAGAVAYLANRSDFRP